MLKTPSKKNILAWANHVLVFEKKEKAKFSIDFFSLDEMQAMNYQFRGKNYPTNVLSFPYDPFDFDTSPLYLGDIALCPELIIKEASEQNKSSEAHFAHLVIHGVLHLLGYDHIINDEAIIMESLEIKLLEELNFSNPYLDRSLN